MPASFHVALTKVVVNQSLVDLESCFACQAPVSFSSTFKGSEKECFARDLNRCHRSRLVSINVQVRGGKPTVVACTKVADITAVTKVAVFWSESDVLWKRQAKVCLSEDGAFKPCMSP